MTILEVHGLNKVYHDVKRGDVAVLDNFSLQVKHSEFVSIVGRSGSGKTTLLEIVAGLQKPDTGEVFIDGSPVSGPRDDCGMVFQECALFPWLNIQRNLEFGPRVRGIDNLKRQAIVQSMIKLIGLEAFTRHYPHELSGGMRQLAAVARALANEPKILLMDEPFAAMDTQTRENLQRELLKIWQQTGETILFVTHNIEEAIFLADRVVVMTSRPGKVKEIISVDLPHPRKDSLRISQQFHELEDYIRKLI
jgi:NitT/TauT family transport system ATP-binding protein